MFTIARRSKIHHLGQRLCRSQTQSGVLIAWCLLDRDDYPCSKCEYIRTLSIVATDTSFKGGV